MPGVPRRVPALIQHAAPVRGRRGTARAYLHPCAPPQGGRMTTTLITGANRSRGLETARRLIEAGHTVYAAMRDPASGDAARELGAHVVRMDVTDRTSVEAAVTQLPELDVLVNNAGIL